jgi:hypothetical protein
LVFLDIAAKLGNDNPYMLGSDHFFCSTIEYKVQSHFLLGYHK